MKFKLPKNGSIRIALSVALLVLICIPTYHLLIKLKFDTDAPEANYPEPLDQAEARKQDMDYLSMFFNLDKSFTQESRAKAERLYAQVQEYVTDTTDAEFELAVAKIVAAAGNGHSKTREYARTLKYNRLPIRGHMFADGYYIIRAFEGYEELLGQKILAIDDTPMFEVLGQLRAYVSGNEGNFNKMVPYILESPELLQAAGIAKDSNTINLLLDNNGISHVVAVTATIEFSNDQINRSNVLLAPMVYKKSQPKWQSVLQESTDLPLYLQQPLALFQTKELKTLDAFYVQFWTNNDSSNQSITAFCESAMEQFQNSGLQNLIVDHRYNSGGNMLKTKDCMRAFPDLVPEQGRIFLIIGNHTFSAGIYSAAYIAYFGGEKVTILGTDIGDELISWGEDNLMELPNSKIQIKFATGKHDLVNGCSDWNTCFWKTMNLDLRVDSLSPDIHTPLFFADYINNRDPSMAVIEEQLNSKP
ncbi:MAG: hypothetical protein ACSHWU_00390 [Marinicella sp.]